MPELHFGAGKVRTSDAAVLQRLLPGSCTQTRLCFLTTEIQTGAITPLPVALEQQHLSTKIRAEEKQASNEHTYPNRTAVISSRAPFPSSHLTRASRVAAASAPISPSPRPGQGHEHGGPAPTRRFSTMDSGTGTVRRAAAPVGAPRCHPSPRAPLGEDRHSCPRGSALTLPSGVHQDAHPSLLPSLGCFPAPSSVSGPPTSFPVPPPPSSRSLLWQRDVDLSSTQGCVHQLHSPCTKHWKLHTCFLFFVTASPEPGAHQVLHVYVSPPPEYFCMLAWQIPSAFLPISTVTGRELADGEKNKQTKTVQVDLSP